MRADMSKVIVERPRLRSGAWPKPKGARRRLQRFGEDGPPGREGIKKCWGWGTKQFNEHLGPLRRYLDTQVGRPWDTVFSEICAHINRNSAVQDHVRDHVDDYVVTTVVLIEGVPCFGSGREYGRPLRSYRSYRRWYVCPRTGLLRRMEHTPRKRRHAVPPRAPMPVRVSDWLWCRFIDGAWYLITLEPLPDPAARSRRSDLDVLLRRPIAGLTPAEARQKYGAEVFAAGRRRLGRKELRHYPIPARWWDGPVG